MSTRAVYLGTKPVENYSSIATHWAVRIGDDNWWEVDGGSGNEESNVFKNTINMGLWEILPSKMIQKGAVGKVHKGTVARSGAKATKKLGYTSKTNNDVDNFNVIYIRNNPEYNFTSNNCQHYVYSLVKMLVGDTDMLPMLETRKYAAIGFGAVVGAAAFAGIAHWLSSSGEEKETEEKETEEKQTENIKQESRKALK